MCSNVYQNFSNFNKYIKMLFTSPPFNGRYSQLIDYTVSSSIFLNTQLWHLWCLELPHPFLQRKLCHLLYSRGHLSLILFVTVANTSPSLFLMLSLLMSVLSIYLTTSICLFLMFNHSLSNHNAQQPQNWRLSCNLIHAIQCSMRRPCITMLLFNHYKSDHVAAYSYAIVSLEISIKLIVGGICSIYQS